MRMIRDRGTIKWTAMMLPEHVKILREWAEEDTYQEQPKLDEQQIEEMNIALCRAIEEGGELMITYYGEKRHRLILGSIHRYDELQGKLQVIDKFGDVHDIQANMLIDVRFAG